MVGKGTGELPRGIELLLEEDLEIESVYRYLTMLILGTFLPKWFERGNDSALEAMEWYGLKL